MKSRVKSGIFPISSGFSFSFFGFILKDGCAAVAGAHEVVVIKEGAVRRGVQRQGAADALAWQKAADSPQLLVVYSWHSRG